MRSVWTGFQLRMSLCGNEERMILQLNHLDDAAVRGKAGECQSIVGQDTAEVIVDLIAVAVALMDSFFAIESVSLGILVQDTRIRTKP